MSVMCLYFAVMTAMFIWTFVTKAVQMFVVSAINFCVITCPAGMSAIIHTLLQSYTNKFLHCNHLANIINL